jgi:hypothetical protein
MRALLSTSGQNANTDQLSELIPEFVKGVINLRGKVIPVIDLRLKFSMKNIEYTESCSISIGRLALKR